MNKNPMIKNTLTWGILAIRLGSGIAATPPAPNIVLIITEDISTDLGCYGRSDLETPFLDRLASEGILYSNAFATSPVCSPSRSALMTGMYQTSTGTHNHRSDRGALPDSVPMLTHLLRDQGYYTCNVVNENYGNGKTDLNFKAEHLFDGADWSGREKNQPFFAQICIYTTHRDTHWEGIEHSVDHPVSPLEIDLPSYYPDHPVNRLDWARYLNSIQYMDKQIGAILERLKQENLERNTVVIFISDHGRCMVRGKQWLYDSGIKIPLMVRWPEQIPPGTKSENMVSMIDITASILEIAGVPIPENMQGRPFIKNNDKIRDEVYAARDRCDAVVDRIRAIRTPEFKLIRNLQPEKPYTAFGHYKQFFYPGLHLHKVLGANNKLSPVQQQFLAEEKPPFELYDLRKDPEETINLADLPAYAEILEVLSLKLEQWMVNTRDQGQYLESELFMNNLIEARVQKYDPLWKERGIEACNPPETHLEWWKQNLGYYEFTVNKPMDLPNAQREKFKEIDGKDLYAYVYYPEKADPEIKYPAIVFFHGGGWRKGQSTQFSRQCEYLASRGMVAIQADYRTMLRDEVSPFECVADAKSAIRWVRENAEHLGIDPQRIAAGGGSAGGHLAAATAMLEGLENTGENLGISSRPDALVLFNPVIHNGPEGYRYDLFGEKYPDISPFHNVRGGQPPVLLLLGTEDPHLSPEQALEFKHSMSKAGNECTLKIYEGQRHGFFNYGKGGYTYYAATVWEMDVFLEKHGFLQGSPTIDPNHEK